MQYESPAALRDGLEARLVRESQDRNRDLQWLRKRVVFERMLVRLETADPGKWVVKGGIAVEIRLHGRTRATKDLDLGLREERQDGEVIREELIDALGNDPEGDWFLFAVGGMLLLTPDEAGRSGWRYPIECSLAGRVFDRVKVDVVSRPDELTATDRLPLPGTLSFAGFPRRDVEVVAPDQQFAEKLHALTRTYGDRPSTRVRDLVDLVILIEEELVSPANARSACERVFRSRDTHPLPVDIPDPPAGWADDYAKMAADVEVSVTSLPDAIVLVRAFWDETNTGTGG